MITCKEYVAIAKQEIIDNIKPGTKLDIFQLGDNPASNAYIKGKLKDCAEVGIEAELHKFEESVTQEELTQAVKEAAVTSSGIIIQLPVPKHIDTDIIMKTQASPEQDVDGFVYDTYDPCTPKGIVNWLEHNKVQIEGANVVIIGRSDIVGKPLARMMTDRNATVTLCHSRTPVENMKKFCQMADIVVVAVGKAKWFSFDVIDKKPVIVDVGINRNEENKLCGDVDIEYMEAQGCYVTPVPGGVGLLTRLALLQNIAQ